MSARNMVLGGIVAVVLAVGAFAGTYLTFFNPKSVAAVALPTPSPISSSVRASSSGSGSSPAALGTKWMVGPGSYVGYRVREQLASLPAPSDAVGRSSAITGTATVTANGDGTVSVSAVSVNADLTQLASDSGRRDGFVQRNALETGRYPNATFVSTEAFTCPAAVVSGAAGTTTVRGKFTIHGQPREVSIPIQVQRSGASVNIVATYKFNWGEYGVRAPQVPVVSVQGNPTVEISLKLTSA